MGLATGGRLGLYEIVASLGAGGMGEVNFPGILACRVYNFLGSIFHPI
jgi:hypothetical protein